MLSDFAVKFYYTQVEADAGLFGPEIITPIDNTVNPQTIVVRIENRLNTGCYATTTFNLVVHPLPVVTAIVELIQCDDGYVICTKSTMRHKAQDGFIDKLDFIFDEDWEFEGVKKCS